MIGSDARLRRLAIWFEPRMTARAQTWKASGNRLLTYVIWTPAGTNPFKKKCALAS